MKRLFALILAICLLCTLASCKTDPAASTGSTTTSPEASTQDINAPETDVTVQQQPMVAVAVPVVTESAAADDGTVLFNQTFQNISLIVPDPEVADKIIVDFLNRTDVNDDAEYIRSLSEEIYSDGITPYYPFWAQIAYDPMRIDRGVLSLYGSYATYTGGAHGLYNFKAVTYDLVTGEILSLRDILNETTTSDNICQLVLDSLTAQKEEERLFEGFESTVTELFNNGFQQNTDWFFSNTGLCFFFSPYEIGPFSSGDIVAEIPYSKLTVILNDAYFPAERETALGTVQAEVFDETALDRFTQFAEVVLEEGSDKILLHTDKSVYDVRIETGTWSADGSIFTPSHTVLAAYSLTPGDAIMIDSPLNSTLPTLRLSYTTGNQTVCFFISLDTAENTVTLTEG